MDFCVKLSWCLTCHVAGDQVDFGQVVFLRAVAEGELGGLLPGGRMLHLLPATWTCKKNKPKQEPIRET